MSSLFDYIKKNYKKYNRGLILSAICLTILTVYCTIDYLSFSSEKDTIKTTVINYLTEIFETNADPRGLSEEHHKDVTNIVEKYWCNADTSLFDGITHHDILDNINYMFTDNETISQNTSVSCYIDSISVKKIGPGYAKATVDYKVSANGAANSTIITAGTTILLDDYCYEQFYDEEKDEYVVDYTKPLENGTLQYTTEDAVFELHYENGTWKICAMEAYTTDSSFVYDSEKEAN